MGCKWYKSYLLCYLSKHKTHTIRNCAAPGPPIVKLVNVVTWCLTTTKYWHKIHHLSPVQRTFLGVSCVIIVYIITIIVPTTGGPWAMALS